MGQRHMTRVSYPAHDEKIFIFCLRAPYLYTQYLRRQDSMYIHTYIYTYIYTSCTNYLVNNEASYCCDAVYLAGAPRHTV